MSVSGSRKDLMRFLLLQVKQNALDVDTAKAFIRTIEEGGSSTEPIAVVGVAGRLPGADDKDAFWANLVAGRESIGDFPEARLDDLRRVAEPGRQTKGGYLDRVDEFDPEYFGITPQAAVELDPYHRMVMELLVETMEDAGHPRSSLEGSRTGVFVGTDNSHRLNMSYLPFLPEVDFSAMSGSWPGLLAGRLSYHFDLRGPAMVTDTGCSSGLLALDSAIKAIRAGDCSGALVAAVNLFLNPGSLGSETESADCQGRAFAAGAPALPGAVGTRPADAQARHVQQPLAELRVAAAGVAVWTVTFIFRWDVAAASGTTLDGPLLYVLRCFCSFIAAYGFAMLFNAGVKASMLAAVVGALANTGRLLLIDVFHVPWQLAVGLAAVTIGLLAQLFVSRASLSRVALSVPAVVIMIPGVPFYRAISALNTLSVDKLGVDVGEAATNLAEVFFVITAIGVGLALARIITDHNWRHDVATSGHITLPRTHVEAVEQPLED